ncbi:Rap1a/Tai family immunity protein [uncultured Paraglaciecola sp.]|uniref:Rap1a/Tai family immunity protein n=1 Tax=uncultured Paraglaciecola sp. TaxID=1765024 RepID=UPI0030D92ABC|tara:strand:+ start:573650 stop:574159 length:510 start_codon:yes stop_codon:yes gene_type:complete
MYQKYKRSNLFNTSKITCTLASALLTLQLVSVSKVNAMEVLSAKELASHCELLSTNPQGVDGQYCIRYIQGFIDGAIATDARVMLNAENAISGKETFAERAMRTRMPGRADLSRAAKLAGFCLGDPLPLSEIVNSVVADLEELQLNKTKDEPAMEVVYKSLLKNYPCKL